MAKGGGEVEIMVSIKKTTIYSTKKSLVTKKYEERGKRMAGF